MTTTTTKSIEQNHEEGLFWMSTILSGLYNQANEKQQEMIADMLVHYLQEYKRAKKETDSLSAVVNFHRLIDIKIAENMDSEMGKGVSCKKGCAFCCNMHVDATDDEADLLLTYTKHESIEIDKAKLQRQSNYGRENWYEQPAEDWSCVFLDKKTKSCKVYKHRPASCRKLSVLSDPKLCSIKNPEQQVQCFAQTEVETIASAAMNVTESGTLAKLLIKKLVG